MGKPTFIPPPVVGVVCPISCGRCCLEARRQKDAEGRWEYSLPRDDGKGSLGVTFGKPCPHLRSDGCFLPRSVRPYPCTVWTCAVSKAVVSGRLSLEEGRWVASGVRWPWTWVAPDEAPSPELSLC
jgi:hypothetical protein